MILPWAASLLRATTAVARRGIRALLNPMLGLYAGLVAVFVGSALGYWFQPKSSGSPSWIHDWAPNVGTAALAILVTVAVVDRIVARAERSRLRPRLERLFDGGDAQWGIGNSWQHHATLIFFDYAENHRSTWSEPPNNTLKVLDHWLKWQNQEDVEPITLADRARAAARMTRRARNPLRFSDPQDGAFLLETGRTRADNLLRDAEGIAKTLDAQRRTDADILGQELILAIDEFIDRTRTLRTLYMLGVGRYFSPHWRGAKFDHGVEHERKILRLIVQSARRLGKRILARDSRWRRLEGIEHPARYRVNAGQNQSEID